MTINNPTTMKSPEIIKNELNKSFLKRAKLKEEQITDQLPLESIFKNDIGVLGHILLDLHSTFKIKPSYDAFDLFDKFQTPDDILKYINNEISLQNKAA